MYDTALFLFSRGLQTFKRASPKLTALVNGREGLLIKLAQFRIQNPGKLAWFHVASLGEYEQAKPVIQELKKRFPNFRIVISFFSPSGYEHAIKRPQEHVDYITYLPFDTRSKARKFMAALQPDIALFVKYDLWANHILEAKKRGIPLFLFSASMRPNQIYFKPYGQFFRQIIHCFNCICCQNTETQELLHKINYHHTAVTGDTRYDRTKTIAQAPKAFPELQGFVSSKKIITVGSAWQEDMDLITPLINASDQFRWIIAPHDIHPEQIAKWQTEIKKPSQKYSKLPLKPDTEVLFIDNIGSLSSLYQFASIAYVGGAFGKGLHNILEPIAYGIPVIFGKVNKAGKFPEAQISQEYGCGFSVENEHQLKNIVLELSDETKYLNSCQNAERLVKDNIGSASRIMDIISSKIQTS